MKETLDNGEFVKVSVTIREDQRQKAIQHHLNLSSLIRAYLDDYFKNNPLNMPEIPKQQSINGESRESVSADAQNEAPLRKNPTSQDTDPANPTKTQEETG